MNQSRSLVTRGHESLARRRSRSEDGNRTTGEGFTNRSILGEERQHVDVDKVNRIQYVLRATALLVAIRELADRDGDIQV